MDNSSSDEDEQQTTIDPELMKANRLQQEQNAEAEARAKAAKIKLEQEAQLLNDRGAMNSMEDAAASILSKYK